MKKSPPAFSRRYKSALQKHLTRKLRPDPEVINRLGGQAHAAALSLLELAAMHEQLLVLDLLPGCPTSKRASLIRNAGDFFAGIIQVIGAGGTEAHEAARVTRTIGTLSGRNVDLATANHDLRQEAIERGKVEEALRKSERQCMKALEKSETLKEQMRDMSHQLLTLQEEERTKISRELHDVVAQALVGINVRLATLNTEAGMNAKELGRNISRRQKMIRRSTEIVHKFARDLRPAALDDLGLIPALHSSMKRFTTRTGVRTHLTAFEDVENIGAVKLTVLYRVAQEALANVERHAHASRVDVTIRKDTRFVRMEVSDDGRSFEVQAVLMARKSKRVGLLGMRERVKMVRGSFEIESEPGKGTKVIALIPVTKAMENRWRDESLKKPTGKS